MSLTRKPAVAGRFYPADPADCRNALDRLWGTGSAPPAMAAIAPHAGWMFSGPLAALSLARIATFQPETIVVFGAVHVADSNRASVYPAGHWETPLGAVDIDLELAEAIQAHADIVAAPEAHRFEHSIEVEVPFLQARMSSYWRLLPIMVRPGPWAAEIGRICAEEAAAMERRVAFVASTDLTHYGPAFDFEPRGRGFDGIRWAKEVNDRRFLDLVSAMDATEIIPEASLHRNACGAGAVSATIAAARAAGASRYVELEHATSAEMEARDGGRPINSVGYAAGVFTS